LIFNLLEFGEFNFISECLYDDFPTSRWVDCCRRGFSRTWVAAALLMLAGDSFERGLKPSLPEGGLVRCLSWRAGMSASKEVVFTRGLEMAWNWRALLEEDVGDA